MIKSTAIKKYLGPFDYVRDWLFFDQKYRLEMAYGHEHPFAAFGKVTELSGVYAFFDGIGITGKCLYVGRSAFLCTRMNQHISGKTPWYHKYTEDVENDESLYEAPHCITVGVKFAPKADLAHMERKFILDLRPKYNAL